MVSLQERLQKRFVGLLVAVYLLFHHVISAPPIIEHTLLLALLGALLGG